MSGPQPFGRYILDERIAMGGMAEIFRARIDTSGFDKTVCIKRILPHFLENEQFVEMFRDEAGLAALLQHANIVQVFDFGDVDGSLFLAMEFVDGADLKQLSRLQKGPLATQHILRIGSEAARGLHYAHNLDKDEEPLHLVHRDVSPHNILVSRAGEVKVTDFGIAKAAARATHTATGVIKGKLAYMSPEQVNGLEIDHRSDQFALGVVLWELFTAERLYYAENEGDLFRKVMQCQVRPVGELRPDLAPAIQDLLMQMLEEDPDDRYPDMRAVCHAFTRALHDQNLDPKESDLSLWVSGLLPPRVSRKTAVAEEPSLSIGGTTAESTAKDMKDTEVFTDNLPELDATLTESNQQTPVHSTVVDEPATTQTLAATETTAVDHRAAQVEKRKVPGFWIAASAALFLMAVVAMSFSSPPEEAPLPPRTPAPQVASVASVEGPKPEATVDAGEASESEARADKRRTRKKRPRMGTVYFQHTDEFVTVFYKGVELGPTNIEGKFPIGWRTFLIKPQKGKPYEKRVKVRESKRASVILP